MAPQTAAALPDRADGPSLSRPSAAARAPGERTTAPRLESLTGLRFLAAVVVFGLHVEVVTYYRSPISAVNRVFLQGGVGVSFFFILSGFVLTWSHRSGDRVVDFYRRRVARIVPLHVLTWAIAGIVLWQIARPPGRPALASLVLLAPWVPSAKYYGAMNVPSWSLGAEMFFYLSFPLLLAGLLRVSPQARRIVLIAALAAPAVWAWVCYPAVYGTTRYWAVYMCPLARLPEFVLGMVLALEVKDGRLPRAPLLPAAVLCVIAYAAAGWTPGSYQYVAVTVVPFALLIVATAQRDAAGERSWLSGPTAVRLGTWSFAFYLIHYPLLKLMGEIVKGRLNAWETILFGAVGFALSVAASAALYRIVERPAERALRPKTTATRRAPAAVTP